jgi:hypothetical protein
MLSFQERLIIPYNCCKAITFPLQAFTLIRPSFPFKSTPQVDSRVVVIEVPGGSIRYCQVNQVK